MTRSNIEIGCMTAARRLAASGTMAVSKPKERRSYLVGDRTAKAAAFEDLDGHCASYQVIFARQVLTLCDSQEFVLCRLRPTERSIGA